MTFLPPTVVLPGSDLAVPPLALGTMYWGTDVTTADSHALLDVAVEHGASFVDTANNYAFWRAGGTGDESEQTIGSWLAGRGPAARDSVTLATKVGARPATSGGDLSQVLGLRPAAVAGQLRASLQRLQTDHVDLLYAHIDDPDVEPAEVLDGMQQLVDDGLARAIAASNLVASRLEQAVAAGSPGRSYLGLQNRFTYLTPAPEADLAPHVLLDDAVASVADNAGIQLLGYSPLLGGAYTRDDRPLPDGYRHAGTEAALDVLHEQAARAGLDAGQTVLAWMGQRQPSVIPIVGISNRAQLDSAITAAATPLSAEAIRALDRARIVA